MNRKKLIKKNFTKVIFMVLVLLCSSCNRFFYQMNKEKKEISIKNITITKSFIQNEKHKKIALTHILPIDKQDNNITILAVPPKGGNSGFLSNLMQPLVNLGYEIYLFDYEGYGESKGKANNQNVLTDAQLVLDYVVSHKQTDAKLLLWGFSLGGNLSVKLAYDNSSKIDALIIEGAFTSHPEVVKWVAPKGFKWVAKLIKSPYPSKQLIKDVQVPIFIAHSLNDKTCPYFMGETLYENANPPKCFLQLSGDHTYGLSQETDKYMNYLALFLIHNNIKN